VFPTLKARLSYAAAWIAVLLLAACSEQALPLQPSRSWPSAPAVVSLEGEPGSGDGRIVQRSRASGGQTIHLGPGERRQWTVNVAADEVRYVLSVTYSNGKEGENEVLSVAVDGATVSTFQDRDSGDATEGWNQFVTDQAGASLLRRGTHTIVLSVSGGDGCVEIDFLTVSPSGGA
jgi:hypothetical protein